MQVSVGGSHTVALRSDGTAVLCGATQGRGLLNVPALPAGVSYVEAEEGHEITVARRSDGSVVAWGSRFLSSAAEHLNVPALPAGLTYVDLAVGYDHSLARRSDGSVVAWGKNSSGECNVPPLAPGLSYVEIAAGSSFSVARLSDGSVVAWGANHLGQCNVPPLPLGLSYVQVKAGGGFSVARRSDGSVVAWGYNFAGQTNVPALTAGLVYVDIATSAASSHVLARVSDGSARAWGDNQQFQLSIPALPAGVSFVEMAAGSSHSVGRRSDGVVMVWGNNFYHQYSVPALPPGFSYVEIQAKLNGNLARFEPTVPPSAPDIHAVTPTQIDALIPGTGKTIRVKGVGLDLTTTLLLDDVSIPPSRYTIQSAGTIMLDMPQTATLGMHELAVSNGAATDKFPITVVAPATPAYELGSGNLLNVVDRDDGLAFILAGQPGSVQRIYASLSDESSTNAYVSLEIGNHFTSLFKGGQYVIPAAGWLQLHVPTSRLPDPGPAGTTFYSQNLVFAFPTPFRVSNRQSISMIR